MELKRREDTPNATLWKDTALGKYVIEELEHHFIKGNNIPTDMRVTAVAKDGMLYFNNNTKELEKLLPEIDRWIPQDELDFLISEP